MKKKILDLFFISLGAFLCAFSTNCFLLPFKISSGGVSGIAQILFYFFHIPLFATSFVLNGILLFLSYRLFSFRRLLKNLLGIALLSLFLFLTRSFPSVSPEPLLAALFGGFLSGVGVGLVMHQGSSTGGTDLVAVFFHARFPHLSLAFLILFFDLLVITLSGILFGKVSLLLYSALTLYIGSKAMDFVLTRGDFAKSLLVMTNQPEILAENLMNEIGRGCTGFYTYSFFQRNDQKALLCVVKSRQVPAVLSLISKIQPSAFTIISDIRQVRGKGFREI